MAPVRVLHVVGQMKRAGVETWLMQLLRNLDRTRVQLEFLALDPGAGHYDPEIRALGSEVIGCPRPSNPLRFGRRLLAILRDRRYGAVHSHVHHFSGFVLGVARRARVPIRIAHSHLDTSREDGGAGPGRRLYLAAMKTGIRRYATHGLAVSEAAAAALFGRRWREDPRWSVLRCAIDFSPFRAPLDREAVRAALGLPPGAVAVVHVGRFDEQKNHRFLVRIAAEVLRREPTARFVLVGEGPLRPAAEAEAARLGMGDRLIFAGVRSDVPQILRACDLFLLPSLYEGLPLVGLEAQAAGLPVVLSDHITRELAVVPDLFGWRSLAEPPEAWAATVVDMLRRPHTSAAGALAALERSDFSLQRSLHLLEELYGAPQAGGRPAVGQADGSAAQRTAARAREA